MTIPFPGLEGAKEVSSIHPLKTRPKPPSPTILSGLKFLVADLSSLRLKFFRLAFCNISPSVRGIWEKEVVDDPLLPSLLKNFELSPTKNLLSEQFTHKKWFMNLILWRPFKVLQIWQELNQHNDRNSLKLTVNYAQPTDSVLSRDSNT